MKRLLFLFFAAFALTAVSCKKDKKSKDAQKQVESQFDLFIEDEYGRQLILHGLNTSSGAKAHPERIPWISEADVIRENTEFGFNFVRYLIFWDFVEPEKGQLNSAYLDEVQKRVEWYTNQGMYVMLDMHQDIYSLEFGGDGAPAWAIRSDGASWEIEMDGPWWLKNISPAVINSWNNFWAYSKHKDLQDHYIEMWKFVAQRFKDNPKVIGYDLMNEPWAGDLVKAFITGEFEKNHLTRFYRRIIPAMREVDQVKYLFFEPAPAPVTFGMPSHLRTIRDAIPESRVVYAPHIYPLGTHEGKPYGGNDKKNVRDWHRERKKEVKRFGRIPLMCGEFGLSPSVKDYDVYLRDITGIFDENLWHWAYWSNDRGGWSPLNADGTETAILPHLVRAYPKATSGRIYNFSYDPLEYVFEMQYLNNPDIKMPTEIFIPRRYYSNGYNLEIETDAEYSHEYDDANQTLYLTVNNKADVSIKITAK